MKTVCDDYANPTVNAAGQRVTLAGQVVPQQIWDIASGLVAFQQARHRADYNTAATITHFEADTEVMRAEAAFLDWDAVRADPAADTFLAELLCRGIPRR